MLLCKYFLGGVDISSVSAPLSVSTSNDLGSANFCVTMAGSQSLVVGFCIRTL